MLMEVKGMSELLAAIGARSEDAILSAGALKLLEKAAEPILHEAQRRVQIRTAKLIGQIVMTKPQRTKGGARIKIGVLRDAGVAYAVPLEWGHTNRDGTVTPPYPFIGPAYESKKSEAYAIIREGVEEALRARNAGRGASG